MVQQPRKEYHYVGASKIRDDMPKTSTRKRVDSGSDVIEWIAATKQPREYDNSVIVTFIIALDGVLWINDRHSEHVLCANGANVLSAGEMTFMVNADDVEVVEVTNQSTGYCPEPDSWWAVEQALQRTNIDHPDDFTQSFIFRRCEYCNTTNIIKDDWFECAVCQSPLPETWNS